jgi:hypothetical protein
MSSSRWQSVLVAPYRPIVVAQEQLMALRVKLGNFEGGGDRTSAPSMHAEETNQLDILITRLKIDCSQDIRELYGGLMRACPGSMAQWIWFASCRVEPSHRFIC